MKKSRRSLVQSGILFAGVVSYRESWVKPVVNSVILPAHALTSIGVFSRIAGVWDARYILEDQPAQFVSGFFGTGFSLRIFENGNAELIDGSRVFILTINEFLIETRSIGWIGRIEGCCTILMGGDISSSFDQIVGSKNVGLSGGDFFVLNKR